MCNVCEIVVLELESSEHERSVPPSSGHTGSLLLLLLLLVDGASYPRAFESHASRKAPLPLRAP